MYEDDSFLPHTLNLRGSAPKPLGGLTEAIFAEVPIPKNQDMPLDRLLMMLMISPDPALLASRLAEQDDHLPTPQPLTWVDWVPEQGLPELSPEDRRTFRAFEQIVLDGRKSSKYEQAFALLQTQFPDIEAFAQLLTGYRFNWHPIAPARAFARELLSRHPGWLLVRLQLARSYLKEDKIDLDSFTAVMRQRLNLDQHLDELESPLTDLLVYQYHLDMYLFFALTGQLNRAAYCFRICHAAASRPEGLQPLAPLVLSSLDPEVGAAAFKQLVRFLKP
ncbi:MAG: hypothetical protein CVV27_01765 [Candidatus Melainabacteria bacterium HGW-Melainabacteria-1]|nr:MAG: hypothetical protein CVV27_01765 [Candidatus Melainabacteria bacterium HGW-Melainabacteria-1]